MEKKILSFLQRREKEIPNEPRSSETGLFFGVYALNREPGVVLSQPMFELILLRLSLGDLDAKTLAQALAEASGIPVPMQT